MVQYETPLGQLGESKPRTDSLFEADTVSLFSLVWVARHKGSPRSPTLQGVSPFPVVETPIPASQYNLVLNPPENSCEVLFIREKYLFGVNYSNV